MVLKSCSSDTLITSEPPYNEKEKQTNTQRQPPSATRHTDAVFVAVILDV
jgi:tRNA1(Val) A37 N6-methylase TrmN6